VEVQLDAVVSLENFDGRLLEYGKLTEIAPLFGRCYIKA